MTAAMLAGPGRLSWVTWRQHRTGLVAVLGLFGLTAAFMAATELNPRWHADATSTTGPYSLVYPLTFLDMTLLPVVAGLVLGARCWRMKPRRARYGSRGPRTSARSRC